MRPKIINQVVIDLPPQTEDWFSVSSRFWKPDHRPYFEAERQEFVQGMLTAFSIQAETLALTTVEERKSIYALYARHLNLQEHIQEITKAAKEAVDRITHSQVEPIVQIAQSIVRLIEGRE